MLHVTLVALALTISGQSQSTDAAANTPEPKAHKEKKICRTDSVTGSFIPKRTCRTAAEWQQIDAQNQADAQQMQDLRGQNPHH